MERKNNIVLLTRKALFLSKLLVAAKLGYDKGDFVKIIEWIKLPEVKNINDLDAHSTTALHSKIIQKKPYLRKLYVEYYNQFKKSISGDIKTKVVVELGSGGGFIKDIMPHTITSDIASSKNIDVQFSGLNIPFHSNKVDAFVMFDVLHHISNVSSFFKELDRCLKVSGKIIMIEPAKTLWSSFIYKNFHHEPFDPSGGWGFQKDGRLSSANVAIPWIVFCRDKQRFERDFPSIKILKLKNHTPFRYLISGGVSMRQLLPSFTYNIVKCIEIIVSPLNKYIGMCLVIELEGISMKHTEK